MTRDENIRSHFCVHFLPYNPETKEVFLIHHKKANLWLSPAGHIDKGEAHLLETLNREIEEELGLPHAFETLPKPFFVWVSPIENQVQLCKEHFEIWFPLKTDGKNFHVDEHEFYTSRWIKTTDAHTLVTHPGTLKATEIISSVL